MLDIKNIEALEADARRSRQLGFHGKLCIHIFKADNDAVAITEENEDECTLCERCLEECGQDAIEIVKLYA